MQRSTARTTDATIGDFLVWNLLIRDQPHVEYRGSLFLDLLMFRLQAHLNVCRYLNRVCSHNSQNPICYLDGEERYQG